MRTISELSVLLRSCVELPAGMKVATNEFREGWNFVTGNADRLEKKVRTRGWNFIKIADGSLKSGVGETSQEAIAKALKLALGRVSEHVNAVEVERIELTQYPWFFLAKLQINPYRIQQSAVCPVSSDAVFLPADSRQRRLAANAPEMFPGFNDAIPQLKQMLVLSVESQVGLQASAQ